MTNTEFLLALETLSLSNRGIGISKMMKSIAIETPLEAKVAVLLSRQMDGMLLSQTPPIVYQYSAFKSLQTGGSRELGRTYWTALEDGNGCERHSIRHNEYNHAVADVAEAFFEGEES